MQISRSARKAIFAISVCFGLIAFFIAFIGIWQYFHQNFPKPEHLIKVTGFPENTKIKHTYKDSFKTKLKDVECPIAGINTSDFWITYHDASYNPHYFEVKKAIVSEGPVTVYLDARNIVNGKLKDPSIYGMEKGGKIILDYNHRLSAKAKNSQLGMVLGIGFGILGILIILTSYYFILKPALKNKSPENPDDILI
ncbi:MAG: hypothetical protein LWY06_13940 [Firmicutes bacterium]|nr:hypothetical protein [Bacillota bacterium]